MKDDVIEELKSELREQNDNIKENKQMSLRKAQEAQELFKKEWNSENNNALEQALEDLSQCESTIKNAKQALEDKKEKIEDGIKIAKQSEADRISNKNGTGGGANKLSKADLLTIKRGENSVKIIQEYINNLS